MPERHSSMHRREVLALSATALASLAGCIDGQNDGGGGTTTPDPDGSGTPSTPTTDERTPAVERLSIGETAAGSVTVQDVTVRQSFRYLTLPDALDVHGPSDRQFVVAEVSASGPEDGRPARDAFGLTVGGETYDPLTDIEGAGLHDIRFGGPPYPPKLDEDPAEGFLLFEIPEGISADSAAVALDAGETVDSADKVRWSLPADNLAALTPPHPETRLVSIEVPDSVSGESIPVELTVANEGEADGVFRAAINNEGPLYGARPLDVSVPAGEERTVEESVAYDWGDADDIQFSVVWAGGTRGQTVRIE